MKFIFFLLILFLISTSPVLANEMFCTDTGAVTSEITDSDGNPNRLYTSLGCLEIDEPNKTIEFFLEWSLGITGGIALLMLIYATIQTITSGGNPEKIKGAKELFMAVLGGVLLLIFSAFILRVAGVEIFNLPGL